MIFNEVLNVNVDFKNVDINNYKEVLTDDALDFLVSLHNHFDAKRLELLKNRNLQQKKFDKGFLPTFPKETKEIREGDWVAAPLPQDLLDRRVEITGPTDRKMVINALKLWC